VAFDVKPGRVLFDCAVDLGLAVSRKAPGIRSIRATACREEEP
jgi:hypothetical protein